ncbi:EamA family transporter [Bacillus sp. FJAT-26390]|uniref:DMT family transporter n=2 Tax=Bacillales TaxID=1385 RepID=UPI00350E37F4
MLVLCSGLTHAIWNLFTKTSRNKSVFLWLIHITAFVLLLPYFIVDVTSSSISLSGYLFMLLTMGFQMGYFFLLPIVYRKGEMSQMYPIMRGTGALLVPLFSVWIYNESLSALGWIGVGCIVLGLFAISGFLKKQHGSAISLRNIFPALMVGLCITGYVMTDKMVLQSLSPLSIIELSNIAYVIVLSPAVLRSKQIKQEWQVNKQAILWGTILSPGSYLLFLYAMNLAPLSHLAPIREIGTVFGTMLGIFLLKESNGLKRILLSAVITMGVIMIGMWGSP